MLEFKINKLITLKLEDNKTNIYVNSKLFRVCKAVILNISGEEISQLIDIKDIDEVIDKYYEVDNYDVKIAPEVEFWGHCSNLQAWVEVIYDTRILDHGIAFPLLKELSSLGDPVAKRQFKSEIVKTLKRGNVRAIFFFFDKKYLKYFNNNEKSLLRDLIYKTLSDYLDEVCQKDSLQRGDFTFFTLGYLIDSYKDKKAEYLLKSSIKKIFENAHQNSIETLIEDDYFYNYFDRDELYSLLFNSNSLFTKKILKFFKDFPHFENLFNKILEKYDYFDKKRKATTGIYGVEAKGFIIGIISDIIEQGYQSIHIEFEEIIYIWENIKELLFFDSNS